MTGCPLLVVADVLASSRWYNEILGSSNVHGGDEFGMIMLDDQLVLMLHHRDIDEHPALDVPGDERPGTGVLLYFWVSDVDAAYARALAIEADAVDEPHMNPNAGAVEFSLRDLDGYSVTVAAKRKWENATRD